MWPVAEPFFIFWIMGKIGVREALNVLLLTSFVGAQPVGEVEQEHDAEFCEGFEALPLRNAVVSPLQDLLLASLGAYATINGLEEHVQR